MNSLLENAASMIHSSEYLVALTGAGISKESNVPTFRGEDGLWRNHNAMDLATPNAFAENPQLVWEWYAWRQRLIADCTPNPAHEVMARWEQQDILKSLITQNVDGLHKRAGSKRVLEVHGNIWRVRCISCSANFELDEPAEGIPLCSECGSKLRPDVVWFGESLNPDIMNKVYNELQNSDLLLVVGTSALVQPAASFPIVVMNNGGSVIEINPEPTPLSHSVDIRLAEKAGEILPKLEERIA